MVEQRRGRNAARRPRRLLKARPAQRTSNQITVALPLQRRSTACSWQTGPSVRTTARAQEQVRRREIPPLETAAHLAEGPLKGRQSSGGELIDEECPAGLERRAALHCDVGAQRIGHAA